MTKSKKTKEPLWPRKHTDSELHGMLQDLLDAGGDMESVTEMNIHVVHADLCEQEERARKRERPPASRGRNLKLVPSPTERKVLGALGRKK